MKKIIAQKNKIFFFSSLFLLIAAFGAVIYYICGPSVGFFHSDCTDSLYWANASLESGQLIADDFRYAAILPFSANLYMMPLIKLFGMTMKTQMISMLIFAVLYAASQIWVFRSMKFSWSFSFCSGAFMLMLLSSSIKMREIMWEHVIYYSLALLFFNCLLAIILRLLDSCKEYATNKSAKVQILVYAILLCISCLLIATDGLAVIVMCSLPLFVGIALEIFFDSERKIFSAKNLPKLFCIVAGALFTLLGLVVLKLIANNVNADYTDVYSIFSDMDKWSANLLKFPSALISLIGFDNGDVSFASISGMVNLLTIAISAIILITPIISLFFFKRLKHTSTKTVVFSYIALFGAIMLLYVFGSISNANWRLVPIVGVSAIATLCVTNELLDAFKLSKAEKSTQAQKHSYMLPRAFAAMALVLSIFSLSCFVNVITLPKDYDGNIELQIFIDTLEENDLTYGYATFWNSQAITMLSDSRVKCREILATAENGAQTDYYNSSYDWYEPQDNIERYFVLLSDTEYKKVKNNDTWEKWIDEQLIKTIYPLDDYTIFVFDGYLEGIAP